MTPSQDPGNVTDRFRMAFEELGPDPEFPGLDLRDITDRLITFSNWPLQTPSKEKLSEAGFYYISKSDLVKCAYCQVKIGRWEPSDDPEVEHRKYSSPSKCLFLLWSKSTTPENFSADERTGDTCGPYGLAGVKQAVLKHDKMTRAVLGDRYHNASFVSVHEDYMYYSERLKTFDDWSSDAKISKEALSEAGFIYRRMYSKSIPRNFSIINWLFARKRKNDIKKTEEPGNVLTLQSDRTGNLYFKKVACK